MPAAPILKKEGRLRIRTHQANGTTTQYVAVRNALMPGVVCCRPTVCARNAEKSNTASTMPAPKARLEKWVFTRLRRIKRRMKPANVKRMPKSHAGGITVTTSFMTTKLKPQIIAAKTNSIL